MPRKTLVRWDYLYMARRATKVVSWDTTRLLVAATLLANGYRQALGVQVLCDPRTEDVLRILDAGDTILDHSSMKFIKIGGAKTR